MMATLLPPDHNIELKCRICAIDFKIASEGVPIFKTDQLFEKIKNYLHINVNAVDKLSHLVCNECVRKLESFHCYALMAQKNQELFNIMYSEKIYREHCTALSSLNTTLYREPPAPPTTATSKTSPSIPPIRLPKSTVIYPKVQPKTSPKTVTAASTINTTTTANKPKVQPIQTSQLMAPPSTTTPSTIASQTQSTSTTTSQQPVALLSTEDITIFAYQDLKLGQIIKDLELLKLILRALKWNDIGKTIDWQLEKLRGTSFRAVLSSPELLRDEDLVQLLGPYLNHGSFAPIEQPKTTGPEYSPKIMDQNAVTEMEVGVDPELFFPYDDEEMKSLQEPQVDSRKATKVKKETKRSSTRGRPTNKKMAFPAVTMTAVPMPTVVTPSTSVSAVPTIVTPTSKAQSTASSRTSSTKTDMLPVTSKLSKDVTIVVKSSSLEETISLIEPTPIVSILSAVEDANEKLSTMAAVAAAAEPMPLNPPATTSADTKLSPMPQISVRPIETLTSAASTPAPSPPSPVPVEPERTTSTRATKETAKQTKTTRKTKAETSTAGPKTRARSVFNAKHKCTVCGKKLATSGNLKSHMKTHKTKSKFNCDKCGRIFKTQANLQRHKDYHAGERFSCRTCGRVYPSNSTLKQHEIAHSNFRPHKCNICLKTFKRNQDLKFHTNQHTGEKPYKCPYCPREFASSGNCFSHRKRVHSDKTTGKKTQLNDATFNKKCIKV